MTNRRTKRVILGLVVLVVVLPLVMLGIMSASASRPENLGAKNGQLASCPDRPNCVSSQATSPDHAIEPLPFSGSAADAMSVIRKIVQRDPRAQIITEQGGYLHAEFRSPIFRFTDDVEFLADESQQVINFRSASRVGYSDLGANRKRMEQIRSAFNKEIGPPAVES